MPATQRKRLRVILVSGELKIRTIASVSLLIIPIQFRGAFTQLNTTHPVGIMTMGEQQSESTESQATGSSPVWTVLKLCAAGAFFYAALTKSTSLAGIVDDDSSEVLTRSFHGRRLQAVGDEVPSYMGPLMNDLVARKKLFEDTPPEEVKYWFEYAGPLQVSRGSAV
jgi:hypothetical protein